MKTPARLAAAPRKPTTITDSRASFTLPVRCRMASLIMPPTVSPTTPAKKTPEANRAEFFRSRL